MFPRLRIGRFPHLRQQSFEFRVLNFNQRQPLLCFCILLTLQRIQRFVIPVRSPPIRRIQTRRHYLRHIPNHLVFAQARTFSRFGLLGIPLRSGRHAVAVFLPTLR